MIALAIWPLAAQIRVWRTPAPRWTIAANVTGASGCYDLPLIGDFKVGRAED